MSEVAKDAAEQQIQRTPLWVLAVAGAIGFGVCALVGWWNGADNLDPEKRKPQKKSAAHAKKELSSDPTEQGISLLLL